MTYLEIHALALVWYDEKRINWTLGSPGLFTVKQETQTIEEVAFSDIIILGNRKFMFDKILPHPPILA